MNTNTSAQTMTASGDVAAELAIANGLPIFENSEPLSTVTPDVPAPTAEPTAPVASEPTPPTEPVSTEPTAPVEVPEVDDLFDLDSITAEPTTAADPAAQTQTQANDPYIDLYEKYNIQNKGKQGLEEFIESKTKEVESLKKATEEVFANDKFKAANEIAKSLGEAESLEYLGLASANYDAVSDEDILSFDLQRRGVKDELIVEYLESMTDNLKQVQAQLIRSELNANKMQRMEQFRQEAAQAAEKRAAVINSTLTNMKEIAGVKVTNDDKARIAKIVGSEEFKSKYGLSFDGKADVKKAVEAAAMLELFPKVLNVAKQLSATKGKAELLNRMSNVQPNTNPTPSNAATILTEQDQMLNDLKQGKGLLSMI